MTATAEMFSSKKIIAMSKFNILLTAIIFLTSINYSQNIVFRINNTSSTSAALFSLSGEKLSLSSSKSRSELLSVGEFIDTRDGKTYKTVKIGTQIWMAENLNYKISSGSWCYDNIEENCNKYGRLYDWETAMKACPSGWHLPTKKGFEALLKTINDNGISLKTVGQGIKDGAGTNTSGFSALLAGNRNLNGSFRNLDVYTYFWSSTEYYGNSAYTMSLGYYNSDVGLYYNNKKYGFSVRCIKE